MRLYTSLLFSLLIFIGCQKSDVTETEQPQKHETVHTDLKFTLMDPAETGIDFKNDFKEDYTYNIFNYEYMYNGGGVAVGDVNGDSLPDLYFSATFGGNRLYLNEGNFKFRDITHSAVVEGAEGFKTGVAMADINGDGRMDIYSCRTSKEDDGKKNDFVFINMGSREENGMQVPYFEEQGAKLGLADNTNTNHVVVFDYDRDGDMDVLLLNHRLGFKDANQLRLQQGEDGSITRIVTPPTPFESNKLYRNDGGKFTDVTKKAGMETSAFGLSATVADINRDGWPDVYVANDYIEPDRIFINNRNGTFSDKYFEYLKHSSQNSMGADLADINNDGHVDIMVMDMKPEDPIRYKELINVMHYDRYNLLVQHGYGRQAGRNVLQLNNGNNTFREIGQFAGVSATDWSWGTLFADFDNDGWKDSYVANGYRKDVTNYDYFNYTRDSLVRTGGVNSDRFPDINAVLDLIPEKKIPNYLFLNDHQLRFHNITSQAGIDQPSFSNGTAYGDLDRDGDLDLIVNNVAQTAFVYRNDLSGKHWLQISVKGPGQNTHGIGTLADIYAGGLHQHHQLIAVRGFFSSSEPMIHCGLGDATVVDSLIMQWPDGTREIFKSIKADQHLRLTKGSGTLYNTKVVASTDPLFRRAEPPQWVHQENKVVDFKRERLIPYMISYEGPCLSAGDINGDQREDIFVGNGSGFPSAVFFQTPDGKFQKTQQDAFTADAVIEDCGSILADFDGDKDLDLVVIPGDNSFPLNDPNYMTRLYINDGKGVYSKSGYFPIVRTNAGSVMAFDYDGDQDLDLFIGGRSTPGSYPLPPKSYVLQNEKGRFVDVTKNVFAAFEEIGMVTGMDTGDLDGDGKEEIVIVGDWLPIGIYGYDGKKFIDKSASLGADKWSGWWKCVTVDDIDGDGDADIVAGNMGLNHRMKASDAEPITMISNDFDGNGSQDPVLCYYYEGKLYPYAGRDAIIGQIPVLKKKFVRYGPYAVSTIDQIFPADKLKSSLKLTANTFSTMVLINQNKKLTPVELPGEVQLNPVYDILIADYNADGKKDILMAGNFLYAETETAEMDAGTGTLLTQQADGSFKYVPNTQHGFWAQQEVRELEMIRLADGKEAIITANNQGPLEIHLMEVKQKIIQ